MISNVTCVLELSLDPSTTSPHKAHRAHTSAASSVVPMNSDGFSFRLSNVDLPPPTMPDQNAYSLSPPSGYVGGYSSDYSASTPPVSAAPSISVPPYSAAPATFSTESSRYDVPLLQPSSATTPKVSALMETVANIPRMRPHCISLINIKDHCLFLL